MGRFFLIAAGIALILASLLFFPIIVQSAFHYDMNEKKAGLSIRIFKIFPIVGGYIQTYPGGLAIHVSQKKAILIPYQNMDRERKKFSFVKTFRLIAFTLTTETGAEYLIPVSIAQIILRTVFMIKVGKRENVDNNVWLTDGDVFRLSLHAVAYFNLFILIKNLIIFIKEKLAILWRKKDKKYTH